MVLVKVLKRRDASSVVVAILVAMILFNLVQTITAKWAGSLSGLSNNQYASYMSPGTGWKGQYLYPVVYALLELLVLEVLGWIYVWASSAFKK
jgi:flagellar biosynthesis protein FlhB